MSRSVIHTLEHLNLRAMVDALPLMVTRLLDKGINEVPVPARCSPAVATAMDFLSSDRVGTEYVVGSGFIMRFGGGHAL